MTARDELRAAAERLAGRGSETFGMGELIAEARATGSTYPMTTLRSMIGGPMCVNSPDHHAVQYGDFVRVGHGQYRLSNGPADRAPVRPSLEPPAVGADPVMTEQPSTVRPWYWEGNVQSAVVGHLVADGWSIERVADTSSKESGIDVVARRNGERILIEVKGYPSKTYTSGAKAGQPKPHHATQARHYLAGALLGTALMRAEDPSSRIVIAAPRFVTYENLAARLAPSTRRLAVEVWLIDADGTVATA